MGSSRPEIGLTWWQKKSKLKMFANFAGYASIKFIRSKMESDEMSTVDVATLVKALRAAGNGAMAPYNPPTGHSGVVSGPFDSQAFDNAKVVSEVLYAMAAAFNDAECSQSKMNSSKELKMSEPAPNAEQTSAKEPKGP